LGPARDVRGHLHRLLTRIAGLSTALTTGLIWTFLADPLYRPILAALAIGSGVATIVEFIFYLRALRATAPQGPMLSFFYLALAISGPITLSSTALLNMLPKPIEARISAPKEDACYTSVPLIQGTWRNLPADSDIWVAAGTLDGEVLYPEARKATKLVDGRWDSSLAYVPPPETKGFYIRVMVVSGEARSRLESYAQDPARMGLGEPPKGAIVVDRIRVRAGGNCLPTSIAK